MDAERIAAQLRAFLSAGWSETGDGIARFESVAVVDDELILRYRFDDGRPLTAFVSVPELARVDIATIGAGPDATEETFVEWLGLIIDEGVSTRS